MDRVARRWIDEINLKYKYSRGNMFVIPYFENGTANSFNERQKKSEHSAGNVRKSWKNEYTPKSIKKTKKKTWDIEFFFCFYTFDLFFHSI